MHELIYQWSETPRLLPPLRDDQLHLSLPVDVEYAENNGYCLLGWKYAGWTLQSIKINGL